MNWIIKTPDETRIEGQSLEEICRKHADLLATHDRRPGGKLPVEIRASRQLSKSGVWSGFSVTQKGDSGKSRNGASPFLKELRKVAPILKLSTVAELSGIGVSTLAKKVGGGSNEFSVKEEISVRKALKPIVKLLRLPEEKH